ncbi:hypothetical protein HOH87_05350 [bacterium]|jgi:hypothetical protein|nr:hypothetical protein [bacterium]
MKKALIIKRSADEKDVNEFTQFLHTQSCEVSEFNDYSELNLLADYSNVVIFVLGELCSTETKEAIKQLKINNAKLPVVAVIGSRAVPTYNLVDTGYSDYLYLHDTSDLIDCLKLSFA